LNLVDAKMERVLWINDKTGGGGAGKLYRTAAAVLAERGATVAPFFGHHQPGEVSEEYLSFQPAALSDKNYAGFLRRSVGDSRLIAQLRRMRQAFRPTAVVVQNCHKYIGPEVIVEASTWGLPVILLVNDYGIYCANCYGWRAGSICHACIDHRFSRAVWQGCALRPDLVTKAMVASRSFALFLAWRADAYFKANVVLTAGEAFRRRLIEAGFREDRVQAGIFPHEVLGAPVDFSPPPASSVPEFVYYGSDLPVKGQELLLEAVRHITKRCRISLYVLKPSEWLVSLVASVAHANPLVEVSLDAEAKWGSGVREAVASARAVLIPSVWVSPHELVVYEAMAMGRAVLVTQCSSNAELIQDGLEGFVVNEADPRMLAQRLDRLSGELDLAEHMGRAARKRYQETLLPALWGKTFFDALHTARQNLHA
jgi:glycosyltransferase involved in cell wall biosynthesis